MMRGRKPIPPGGRLPRLKDETGSGLVEYAIVFTVFMAMLLGVADFGRAMYAYHFVSSAARDATRYAAVRGQGCKTDTCWFYDGTTMPHRVLAANDLKNFVQNTPLGIDHTKVSLTPAPVWSDATNEAPGSTVQVTVSYVFNFTFPFVYKNALTFTSQSQTTIVH